MPYMVYGYIGIHGRYVVKYNIFIVTVHSSKKIGKKITLRYGILLREMVFSSKNYYVFDNKLASVVSISEKK